MAFEVKIPSVGESITEVSLLKWLKEEGSFVQEGDALCEVETDKATVELNADQAGVVHYNVQEGDTLTVGDLIATIDTKASAPPPPTPPAPSPSTQTQTQPSSSPPPGPVQSGPAVRKIAKEQNIDLSVLSGTGKGGRVTKGDLVQHLDQPSKKTPPPSPTATSPHLTSLPNSQTPPVIEEAGTRRVKMSRIRKTIAKRLVEAKQKAALLTTFNEVDMGPVMKLRNQYKEPFKQKYGVPLSYMSFFTKASIAALKAIPAINAFLEEDTIVYHDHTHIGIAVGTDRGLVVPVIRNADTLSYVALEKQLAFLAQKARDGKLSIEDMSGGTFTISNGGVYGSLLSTPILNPPQSAILGMHKIQKRPMVVDDQITICSMMYLALSYDHRIVDGKEAVTFLVTLKEYLENPEKTELDFVHEL